jgi:hypothetical protein
MEMYPLTHCVLVRSFIHSHVKGPIAMPQACIASYTSGYLKTVCRPFKAVHGWLAAFFAELYFA